MIGALCALTVQGASWSLWMEELWMSQLLGHLLGSATRSS